MNCKGLPRAAELERMTRSIAAGMVKMASNRLDATPLGHTPFSWSGGAAAADRPLARTISRCTQTPTTPSVTQRSARTHHARQPAGTTAQQRMRRFRATCAYDGSEFNGWMIQQQGVRTVQGALEERLGAFLRTPTTIAGAGRTDAGVSARAAVFHFDAPCDTPDVDGGGSTDEADAHRADLLLRALQTGLPPALRVLDVQPAPPDFHARHSCLGKRYTYRVLERAPSPFETRWCWSVGDRLVRGARRELDVGAMAEAAKSLVGVHDFSLLSAMHADDPRSPVRHLWRAEVVADGEGGVEITAEADRFMYKQMRMMAGTLVMVGLGRMSVDDFRALVQAPQQASATPASAESKTRARSLVYTAPAQGLMLEHVFYGARGERGPDSTVAACNATASTAASPAAG